MRVAGSIPRRGLTDFGIMRAARGLGPGGVGAPLGRHTICHSPSRVGLGGRRPLELPGVLPETDEGRLPRHQSGRSSLNLAGRC